MVECHRRQSDSVLTTVVAKVVVIAVVVKKLGLYDLKILRKVCEYCTVRTSILTTEAVTECSQW